MKCSICTKIITTRQQRIGLMHETCHSKLTKKPPLYKHQAETKRLLKRHDYVFDMSDPGTGKTRPALESWAERRRKKGGCLLVIAVKSNLDPVWGEEAAKWTPDMELSIAYAHNRSDAFQQPADIYVTNTDATKWLASQRAPFFKKFDSIIVDESSFFKHRTSARSKALIRIAKYFRFREMLSGTPTSNGICDIWNQVLFLDEGRHLGSNFWKFRTNVCDPIQIGPDSKRHVSWVDKEFAEEAVLGLINKFCIRHDLDECTSIPKNFVRRYRYNLPSKLMARYKQLEEEAYIKINKGEVVGTNAAVLRGKLFQLCSGAVYTQEGKYEVLDNERYKIVADLVEERKHSICFFNWQHQRDLLITELTKRKIEFAFIDGSVSSIKKRNTILNEYAAGKYQTILLHPKTGAHGINQLVIARHVIYTSPLYEPDLTKQGIARVRRSGQKYKTETIIVTANRTVEEIVYTNRERKQNRIVKFFDVLKECKKL